MSRAPIIAFFALVLAAVSGCNALLALDNYRACEGTECDGGVIDAPTDQADAKPIGGPCSVSSDCTKGDGNVVCSNSVCVSVTSLAQGSSNHECAVMSDGTMWCWGDNTQGALGRGTAGGMYPEPRPIASSTVSDIITLGIVGNDYSCALTQKHDVWCWGQGTTGGTKPQSTRVSLPRQATGLWGGGTDACALLDDGSVYCWGTNAAGEVGCPSGSSPSAISTGSPNMLVAASANIAEVAVGIYATCARESNNDTVHCFGNDSWGGFGNGTTDGASCSSAQISGFASNYLDSITSGDFALCAKDINGNMYWWGQNEDFNNAGIIVPTSPTADYTTPLLNNFKGTTQTSIGWLHSCVLDLQGHVTCWGESSHGTAGTYAAKAVPKAITGLPSAATQIASQRQYTCALLQNGDVYCWGNDQFGTLGQTLESGVDTPTPLRISW